MPNNRVLHFLSEMVFYLLRQVTRLGHADGRGNQLPILLSITICNAVLQEEHPAASFQEAVGRDVPSVPQTNCLDKEVGVTRTIGGTKTECRETRRRALDSLNH